MRKAISFALCLICLTTLAGRAPARPADSVLEFQTMVGVSGPFRGMTNAIRGVPGAGAPWVIREGIGKLTEDGRLEVRVRGLVLTSSGMNPVANFRAIVSCLSEDELGNVVIANVSTGLFPATTSGDADIEANLHHHLPTPCVAPIIFVTSPTGSWFAVTGR